MRNKNRLTASLILIVMAGAVHAQGIAGSWKGNLDAGIQKLEMIFNFTKAPDGSNQCTIDIPEQGAQGIPAQLLHFSRDSVSLRVAAIGMTYTGKLTDKVIHGTFRQGLATLPLELKPGRPAPPDRPQEPKAPFPYTTEEVTFNNPKANATLAGTLTFPVGYKPGKRTPVVLMVTGSGPQKRDEGVFDHKPFLVLADFLARHGIASLRYDDRGIGQSTGSFKGATSKDFADDAKAGLDYLKKRRQFGPVGLLGHSEGGLIAFMIGAQKAADFLVVMAGPGIKGDTLIAEQANANLQIYGQKPTQSVKNLRRELAAKPQDPWMNYFIDCDPAPYIRQISIPLMAINGSKDHQVLPQTNLKMIRELQKNGNRKNLIKEYEGLNHLFQHCTTGGGNEYYQIEETISPEVLSDIANWINGL
ncbi:alpha/beta hydrolase [Prevotella sp. oral taxon 376]|uniref:alpha/beta hydrolase family protein n=1 Tax=Prevotella sp. oral taxon 376 TaxID=712466 RepID=UPI000D1DA89B|nr:alpha/beta hydrolase [Prevotella sp. oral taxon 376]PTL32463.1 alpha/beta hydrolase [Prevotella sp. oral taxon 376]